MTRQEIKAVAREKIKGNKWKILCPFLVILVVAWGIGFCGGLIGGMLSTIMKGKLAKAIITLLINMVVSMLSAGVSGTYMAYILKFIRTGNAELSDMKDCFKARWKQIIWAGFLVGLFTFLWSLLFVIPGIIAVFSYAMAGYIAVDSDLSSSEVVAKSKEMMRGHKFELFIFGLSFIGWNLLAPVTFGILYVWLLPYMIVSSALYYDQLKNGGTFTQVDISESEEIQEGIIVE